MGTEVHRELTGAADVKEGFLGVKAEATDTWTTGTGVTDVIEMAVTMGVLPRDALCVCIIAGVMEA